MKTMIKFDTREDERGRPKITFQADQNTRSSKGKQAGSGRPPAVRDVKQGQKQASSGSNRRVPNPEDPALGHRKRPAAGVDDAGILTETQLKAILQSVEKLTSNGERDVQIEVDGLHNRVKIEGRLHQPWAVSEDADQSAKKPPKPPPQQPPQQPHSQTKTAKPATGTMAKTKSETLDEKMQRLIAENMDKLSEEALVDLLSKVYVEEKQRMLSADEAQGDASTVLPRKQPYSRTVKVSEPVTKAPTEQPSHATVAASSVKEASAAPAPPPPPAPLTKAEQKRQQWARELAEQKGLSDYDPWGRPGAGAPPLSSSGRLQQQDLQHTAQPAPQPPQRRPSLPEQQQQQQPLHQQLDLAASNNQPAAIRSSFLAGQLAPDASRFDAAKEAARRQWLAELESQREEQRRARQSGEPPPTKFWTNQQVQQLPPPPQQQQSTASSTAGFQRGRGGIFGGDGAGNAERRRQDLEHQAALLAQAEERRLQKAQERARAAMEDAEAERRAWEAQPQQQSAQVPPYAIQGAAFTAPAVAAPQPKKTQSSPTDLAQALLLAEETSKIQKALARIEKLEAGGHDTSNLRRNLLATYSNSPQLLGLLADAGIVKSTSQQAAAQPQPTQPPPSPPPRTPPPAPSHRHVIVEPDEIPGLTGTVEGNFNEDFNELHEGPLSEERLLFEEEEQQRLKQLYKQRKQQQQQQQQQQQTQQNRTRRISGSRDEPARQPRQQQQPPQRQKQPAKQQPRPQNPVPVSERPPWGSRARGQLKKTTAQKVPTQKQQQKLQEAPMDSRKPPQPQPNNRRQLAPQQPAKQKQQTQQQQQQQSSYHRTYELPSTRRESPSPPRAAPPQPARAGSTAVPFVDESNADHYRGFNDDNIEFVGRSEGHDLIRTSAYLNPATAGKPLPISRETTARELARKAYMRGLNPSHYGVAMDYFEDESVDAGGRVARRIEPPPPPPPPSVGQPTKGGKDPIFHPGLVKDSPTSRQDAILLQLSTIRQGLLDKQKEIETSLSVS